MFILLLQSIAWFCTLFRGLTPSRLLCKAYSHAVIMARKLLSHIYPPLFVATYTSIQVRELEQHRLCERAQGSPQQTRSRTRGILVEQAVPSLSSVSRIRYGVLHHAVRRINDVCNMHHIQYFHTRVNRVNKHAVLRRSV